MKEYIQKVSIEKGEFVVKTLLNEDLPHIERCNFCEAMNNLKLKNRKKGVCPECLKTFYETVTI